MMYREKLAKIVDQHIDTINKSGATFTSGLVSNPRYAPILQRVRENIVRDSGASDIVGYIDMTLIGYGKAGLVFTEDALYERYAGSSFKVRYLHMRYMQCDGKQITFRRTSDRGRGLMSYGDVWIDSGVYDIPALKTCLEEILALRLDSLETGRDFELELLPPPYNGSNDNKKTLFQKVKGYAHQIYNIHSAAFPLDKPIRLVLCDVKKVRKDFPDVHDSPAFIHRERGPWGPRQFVIVLHYDERYEQMTQKAKANILYHEIAHALLRDENDNGSSEEDANRFAVEHLGKMSRADAKSMAWWWCGYYGRNDIKYMTDVFEQKGS